MFGTKFLNGQGLGNQLFCYVSARCIAGDLGYAFGCAGKDQFGYNIHNCKGLYFMDMDLGGDIDDSKAQKYYEREDRIITPSCWHDAHIGCYVSGYDSDVYKLSDNTLIYGNLQSEKYFLHHRDEIKKWLKVKEEYDKYDLSSDDICVLNMRGGEYIGNKALYLKRDYWINAMDKMREINLDMRFVIVTEDIPAAQRMFPDLEVFHGELADDYTRVKNAHYLILSNSSFAYFPVLTSETIKYLIAPKYWARHNVSDGYWSSEQNIYTGWNYLGRNGKVYTAEECREELILYREGHRGYFARSGAIWNYYCKCVTDVKRYREDILRFIGYKIDGLNKRLSKLKR